MKRGGRSVQKRRRCGAIASDKNGRVRIEAPVRLSHAESWREGVVIHCKGGPNPRNWAAGLPGQATSQDAARKGEEWLHRLSVVSRRFSFRIEPTISGNVNGKEGNATETHGTRNGTHGDVGKIDMCVLNPVPWNPGRKWEGAGVSIGEFKQLRVSGRDRVNKKSSYCGVVEFQRFRNGGNGKPDIRAGGKRLADDTAPHRAGEAGEGETDAGPRREIWARVPPSGRGPADEEGATRGGQGTDGRVVGEKPISDGEDQTKDLLGVKRMMEDHLGVKRMMEDHLGVKGMMESHLGAECKMLIRIWDLHRVLIRSLILRCRMSSPVHHELGERRMRYGPKGTRAYARKPYRDAWDDVVPALFPDEEEMEFAEPPNAPIQETTVSRRILMPHFQRAAEYRRLYQGQGTFQFAPEVDTTPPTRGRGRPRKTGPTRASPGPIRMEDSVPTRKRGRPRKIPSIDAGSLRSITGMCRSEEDVEVEEDPSEDSDWEEEPASPRGSGRAAGPKQDGEQKSPKRSPAENSRRLEALAVDSLSLSSRRLSSPSLSSPRLFSLSLLAATPSLLSLSAASLSPRREQPRVVVVAAWCHRSQIPLSLTSYSQIQIQI
ncbi:hypothetical protein YC2023_033307 [Brassica napus]